MDPPPPPPYDHPHHRRSSSSHHYPDQHHHFAGGSGGGDGSRRDYEPLPGTYHRAAPSDHRHHNHHHLPSDHNHHQPRLHHHHHQQQLPPPPPLPQHLHETALYAPPPIPSPPGSYSSPRYHHHYHQHHGDDEIRHHNHYPQHQLPWEEVEEDRRHYAPSAHQLRLSPSGPRKRQRCAMHDGCDLESISSSGAAPRHLRQQPTANYPLVDTFVDRTTSHPGYGNEGFSTYSDSKGGRKMQMPAQVAIPGSPHAAVAVHPRRTPQKPASRRLSVWQRIEEKPVSPRLLPKAVHISPCKSNNAGSALKELASMISMDCKGKSAGSNDGDSTKAMDKSAGNKTGKVLSSVLVKPSPEAKGKQSIVEKVTANSDNAQKNVPDSTSKNLGLTSRPVAGGKKIVIKKIVRKIGGKDKQISTSIISQKSDSMNAHEDPCEKEEGEITTSSFEKDIVSKHSLVCTSYTAGASIGVNVQKDEFNNLTNPRKRSAPSVFESMEILDQTSVSGSKLPQKEGGRSSIDRGDISAASALESIKVFDTSRSEHPGKEDRGSMDSGDRFVFQNDNHHEEGEILSCENLSTEESTAPKDTSENNNTPVSGTEGAKREDNNILVGTNEEKIVHESNFIVGPSTREVTIWGSDKNEAMILIGSGEKSISSLGDTVETPRTTEINMSQYAQEEEGSMLTHPNKNGPLSISYWGARDTIEGCSNEDIQDKQRRLPMKSSEANTSGGHVKASKTMELSVNEDTEKKGSKIPTETCKTKSFKIMHPLEAPTTAEAIVSKFVAWEGDKSTVGSNGGHFGISIGSLSTSEFNLAGGTEDNSMKDFLNNKTVTNETDASLVVEGTAIFNLPSSRDDPIVDSTSDIILNNGEERDRTAHIAELMHLHRGHMSPENDFTLVHSRESPSVSGNNEFSVPTTLTLASNFYFSSTGSVGQPEENHKLVEGQQGLGVATSTKFDCLGKRKGFTDDDLISAGVQNWLTLPSSVDNIALPGQFLTNDTTVRKNKLDLDQSVDNDIFANQHHGITQDMDQYGSMDASSMGNQFRLCGSDMPQSDLVRPNEISGDVENYSGIVLSGLNSDSHVLDRHGYQMVDSPVCKPIEPVLSASESTDAMDAELVSSQLCVDPDHIYHSNTEGPVVDSNTRQDLLSSWIESIVSEAKKDHEPCKSTLPSTSLHDKLLAPNEDSRSTILDSVMKSPQMNFTSPILHKVASKQVSLPSSSGEPPRSSQNARRKTWHRNDVASSTSSIHASQPLGLPPKQPPRKNDKTQNSYIRKGNALIRNPITGNLSSSGLDTRNKLNKPARRSMNFVRKVDSNDSVVHTNISVERPKTPPLPLQAKSISSTTNLSEQLSQTLHKQLVPETKKDYSTGQLNSGGDNPSIKITQKIEASDASKVVYVRHKSNQLVAAQRQHLDDSSKSSMDKVLPLQPPTTADFYFKKRKNQIILSSSSDGQNTKDMTLAESLYSGENKGLSIASLNNSTSGLKDGPHKALQIANNVGSFSHVWTLSGQQPQRKRFMGTSYMKAFPRILPWKRKIYYKKFRSSHTQNTSSLRIVRKLLHTKKRDMIYTVSTNGFSMRKSALLSVGGSSLKWSRSLEKRSQNVNEEATLAVAEFERKKKEKRKRQSLRHIGRNDQYSVTVGGNQLRNKDLRSSTCNEYVRVSKGNQLVRNPKKVICMLANEKVRWSLHTVRSRQAKKQQYCQFFTRFGVCKKPVGKCPYIHDRAKVTICTKFLKGLCSETGCKLTHKVLPERMQDCSYFLRGLCTNTACPYRHVKVNSNAPVCEDFLKGYCADGDECRRKHTYTCTVFEATGQCPQQSKCKLHHPKKHTKSNGSRPEVPQNSRWGRYFDTSIGHESKTRKVSSDEDDRHKPQDVFSGGDFVDFIGLDDDSEEEADNSGDIQLMELDNGDLSSQADNMDELIKPLRIMRTARV